MAESYSRINDVFFTKWFYTYTYNTGNQGKISKVIFKCM